MTHKQLPMEKPPIIASVLFTSVHIHTYASTLSTPHRLLPCTSSLSAMVHGSHHFRMQRTGVLSHHTMIWVLAPLIVVDDFQPNLNFVNSSIHILKLQRAIISDSRIGDSSSTLFFCSFYPFRSSLKSLLRLLSPLEPKDGERGHNGGVWEWISIYGDIDRLLSTKGTKSLICIQGMNQPLIFPFAPFLLTLHARDLW